MDIVIKRAYASGTGIDQSLEMNRFVWTDLDAALTRLISEAPATGVFTCRVEITVCTALASSIWARALTSV